MKRAVLLLVVGSLAMLVVLLRTPLRTSQLLRGISEAIQPAESAGHATDKPAAPAKPSAASRQPRVVKPRSESSATLVKVAPPSTEIPRIARSAAEAAKSDGVKPSRETAIIASDQAPVYSINSPSGQVLRILNKGTTVHIELEVIASGSRWTLIRTEDEKVSGFVASETLSRLATPEADRL